MLHPCYLAKNALNRIKEKIPSLQTIEQNSLYILKIMIIFILIFFLFIVIFCILDNEDGVFVQPFEIAGLGENVDGKSLATLLSHDLQRIKDIYEPVRDGTAESNNEGGNMVISRPLKELSVDHLSIKSASSLPLEDILSKVEISGPIGTSLSIGSLLYPLKEFLGNKANSITCSFQRYNSSIVAVAILEEYQSPEKGITSFEYYANISNVEQIPYFIEDLAFMIALELSKQRSQNKDELYPQSWQTFKYVTHGVEAINDYKAMKGICYQKKINYLNRGRDMALSAIEFEPGYKGSFDLLSFLGFAYLEMGEYDESLIIFKNISEHKPFESSLGIGLVYSMQERYSDALDALEYALQQDSQDDYFVWNNKGIILSKQGNHIEATRAFKNAITINPKYGNAWRHLGDSFYYLGENNTSAYNDANWAYEKAIMLNPKDEMAWKNKGNVLYRQGKYDDAIEAYKEAIKLNSKDAAAWRFMAASLQEIGRYGEAEIAYNTSLQINSVK